VTMHDHKHAGEPASSAALAASHAPGKHTRTARLQRRAPGGDAMAESAHDIAARGTSGAAQALPYSERIQQAFGRHDVSGVRAFVGGPAQEAAHALGAQAYASGSSVAFGAAPDLHTAAHEAAHVVQRGGVQLQDGLGQSGTSPAGVVVKSTDAKLLDVAKMLRGHVHEDLVKR
jgi:hypothetical protein